MSEMVIIGITSFLMILLGTIMAINTCLSKKHQRMQQALAEELAFARIN